MNATSRVCTAPTDPPCPDPYLASGYCSKHWQAAKRHNGDPLGGWARGEQLTYYLAHVDVVTDQCVVWPYGANGVGYGQIYMGGTLQSVHVAACERHHGPRPAGMHALHAPVICHDPSCFNALGGHVFWGTPQQNMSHKALDGTNLTGERSPGAKLTWDGVTEIRVRYAAGGILQRELAAEYGVSSTTISRITRGVRWKASPRSPLR